LQHHLGGARRVGRVGRGAPLRIRQQRDRGWLLSGRAGGRGRRGRRWCGGRPGGGRWHARSLLLHGDERRQGVLGGRGDERWPRRRRAQSLFARGHAQRQPDYPHNPQPSRHPVPTRLCAVEAVISCQCSLQRALLCCALPHLAMLGEARVREPSRGEVRTAYRNTPLRSDFRSPSPDATPAPPAPQRSASPRRGWLARFRPARSRRGGSVWQAARRPGWPR